MRQTDGELYKIDGLEEAIYMSIQNKAIYTFNATLTSYRWYSSEN